VLQFGLRGDRMGAYAGTRVFLWEWGGGRGHRTSKNLGAQVLIKDGTKYPRF